MRPNSNMVSWAVLGGAVVLAGAAVAAFYLRAKALDSASADPARRASVEVCARQPKIPWEEMLRALEANDVEATTVWANECVRISGVVKEVAPDGAFILIDSNTEEVASLSCLPLHPERARAEFAPGKPINVWGFGEPRRGLRYSLASCDWET